MIVYRHRRNDTLEIFYVGIGKTEKRAYSTRDRTRHWHNIVNKCGYTVEIIANPDTWEDACDLEKLLISEYGRRDLSTGQLVNMTDGGEGILGLVHSDEAKSKMSIAKSNMSEETKAKMSKAQSNRSVEHREKISKCKKNNTNFLGKKHSEQAKSKISEAKKGKKLSDEHKSKISEAGKGRKHSDKTKQKMSEVAKGSKNVAAKLTEQQAYEIKYCNFNSAQEKIAFIYGVSQTIVSKIRLNKLWMHI